MAVETGGGDERGFGRARVMRREWIGVVVVEDVKCAGLDRWMSFGLDRYFEPVGGLRDRRAH
jgi:hypothetical protein